MKVSNVSTCGILFCYNEEHILRDTLKHYLGQGIDLLIVDNCSTDSSMDIVKSFISVQAKACDYKGEILDVIHVKTVGYEWKKILKAASKYMHERLNHYDWIMLIDADSLYFSPVKNMSLLEYMEFVRKHGYNIIEGKLYEFYPTEKDDQTITSPVERIKFYTDKVRWGYAPQHKIFLYHPSIDFYSGFGHECHRDNARIWDGTKFIYKHYSWCSYEHGLKKIFKERKPRYVERIKYPEDQLLHRHFMEILPIKKDLILQSQKLKYFKEEKLLLSRPRFFLFTKTRRLGRIFSHVNLYIKQRLLNTINKIKTRRRAPLAIDFPAEYHFLMTNYCNAQCIFCNQEPNVGLKEEITLEIFKKMISNIPVKSAHIFCFTGGGEPLLCRDLFSIIKYVNTSFPWIKVKIRTNGLLIGKYAKELSQLNIHELEISVHGGVEMNDYMIQRKGTQDIFSGIALLNSYLEECNKKTIKTFYPTVSRININDAAELIKMASELDVNNVKLSFCQYYPYKINDKVKVEDSLIFHEQLYQNVIQKSRKLAKSSGIKFKAPSQSIKYFKKQQKQCEVPWLLILINWDGTAYPCPGWEVAIHEKIKSGEYYFGNILKEHLGHFWNNESWIKIRRTRLSEDKECLMPECSNCPHNPYSS